MIPLLVFLCWWLVFGFLLSWWAGKKNRNRIAWGLVGPAFVPASLIVLGFSSTLCPSCRSPLAKGDSTCVRCQQKDTNEKEG